LDNRGTYHSITAHIERVLSLFTIRRLPRTVICHHIDENKSNNAPENLLVTSKRLHGALHVRLRVEKYTTKLSGYAWIAYSKRLTELFIREHYNEFVSMKLTQVRYIVERYPHITPQYLLFRMTKGMKSVTKEP
jgi:hypothetical protein